MLVQTHNTNIDAPTATTPAEGMAAARAASVFAGAFSDVIFAIVERDDARDGGNIAIFREVLSVHLRSLN